MNMDVITQEIREFLDKRGEVSLAFIFGSFAEGRLNTESDVDIALLFRVEPDISTLTDIMNWISNIVKRDIDIVVLNNASPIIRMQVLRKGRLLKKVDERIYCDFYLRTVKEYDDIKIIRRAQEENILKGKIYGR
jgi:predicted nucleotidyltransferase